MKLTVLFRGDLAASLFCSSPLLAGAGTLYAAESWPPWEHAWEKTVKAAEEEGAVTIQPPT
jgi:hypothetical protein